MNRIYQGRVAKVETVDRKGNVTGELPLEVLWHHHELFQDAVNYYTLALSALSRGMDDAAFEAIALKVAADSARRNPKHKTEAARVKAIAEAAQTARAMIRAIKSWRDAVSNTAVTAERRGKSFEGWCKTLAPAVGVVIDPTQKSKDAFARCISTVLASSRASDTQRAAALLQLLEEADKSDLSWLANDRLGFFCNPKGRHDKTPKDMASLQEIKRQRLVREFRSMPDDEAISRAAEIDLGLFLTTPPKEKLTGTKAAKLLRKYWDEVSKQFPSLMGASAQLEMIAHGPDRKSRSHDSITQPSDALCIPAPGRRPSGVYPAAALFRHIPCAETLAAFRAASAALCDAKDKQPVEDSIAASRVDDTPHFPYFTRLVFENDDEAQQAPWKEFDHAAFVAAITSPHRYYQDTIRREAEAAALREDLQAMESEGRAGSAEEGMAAKPSLPGFRDDARIDRLVSVLFSDLGHLGEVDSPDDDWLARPFITEAIARADVQLPDHLREYTLRERTLRGWHAVRDAWRDLAAKSEPTEDDLWEIVKKEQGEHRLDFGSAHFYEELTKPANHGIWKEKGSKEFHAGDPVEAWAQYTETRRELRDKERPIHFTPAHPTKSPRYFIFPKKSAAGGKWGSTHERSLSANARGAADKPGALSFTAGVAVRDGAKWKPVMTRISYSAPRLRRDQVRRDGEESLDAAPWLPPMIDALKLHEPPLQDFGNCRITLQPRAREDKDGIERYGAQLTFPVEIQPEKLIAQIGKAHVWSKQFRSFGKGSEQRFFYLLHSFEQPKDPPPALEQLVQRFTFGSVDFGLHADSWAMQEARLDGVFESGNSNHTIVSRAITTGEEAPWRVALRELRKLRLPGSDTMVWRARSKLDP